MLALTPWRSRNEPHPLVLINEGLRNLSLTPHQLQEISVELHAFDYGGGRGLPFDDEHWAIFDEVVHSELNVAQVNLFLPCDRDKGGYSRTISGRSQEDWDRMRAEAEECMRNGLWRLSSQGRLRIIFLLLAPAGELL
jgi:hypothetical protein